jgi:RNA polymerase sigma factor (sigma-70 family)
MDGTDHDELATAVAFVSGDDAAFEALYRRYARPIHDYVLGIARNRAMAEDITQTVFVRAFEQRGSVREPAAVRGWLYRIAHNCAVNEVSRAMRTDEISEQAPVVDPDRGPAELAEQDESARLVWDAAASLETRQYEVLDLALRKGLTTAEIAAVLGLDAAQASLALHRAREALGNAVRYLVVARRRRHCDRLAELVPAGVRTLTPEQRASVDRHMRRCDQCQRTAMAMTAPSELFAAVPPVALPAGLLAWAHTAASGSASPGSGAGRARPRGGRALRSVARRPLVSVVAASTVVAAVVVGVVVASHHPGRAPAAGPSARPTAASSPPASGPSTGPSGQRDFAAAAGTFHAAGALASNTYYSASCPSATTCDAVGADSAGRPILTRTTDAGQHWRTQALDTPSPLGLLDCVSVRHCVAARVSHGAYLFVVSNDGGSTWQPAVSPPLRDMWTVSCPSPLDCLAVGGQTNTGGTRQAAATADGGQSWHAVAVPGPAYSVDCVDPTHCWASGSLDRIWLTRDLGASWTPDSPPRLGMPTAGQRLGPFPANTNPSGLTGLGFYVNGVGFTSAADGFAFGGARCGGFHVTKCPSGLYRTTDGGATWTFWSVADESAYGDGQYAACTAAGCLLVTDTFTHSVLLTSTDGLDWTQRQTFPGFVGRPACTSSGTTCVLLGAKGLYTTSV